MIRGHRVILDTDLARLYGIPTMRLNEVVKRNADRFPSDFAFQLIPEEWEESNRSQISTASPFDLNPSQNVIGSQDGPMQSQIVIASPGNGDFDENSQGMRSQIAIASPKERRAKR
ncbi:MAG TPA: ORF6N domain-containing protein, partial [Fibrobacteria bacterium]|nr:ORF6N domain-containing protein [Fibrobacteria bacterium]